eukprot:CAMPEP_0170583450 /NCGR_PEP_ID=MMETSP0224-20130122/8142_1 /TAXON_ID=285029 /ORGANISM="Togula jolla, Strain CCCM 725" /LENGTH=126 /DNA_ID=CAMNT_0010906779 /DNA_START=1487 /DNA_END=1864 /DNA_ORIENTATION=+
MTRKDHSRRDYIGTCLCPWCSDHFDSLVGRRHLYNAKHAKDFQRMACEARGGESTAVGEDEGDKLIEWDLSIPLHVQDLQQLGDIAFVQVAASSSIKTMASSAASMTPSPEWSNSRNLAETRSAAA